MSTIVRLLGDAYDVKEITAIILDDDTVCVHLRSIAEPIQYCYCDESTAKAGHGHMVSTWIAALESVAQFDLAQQMNGGSFAK